MSPRRILWSLAALHVAVIIASNVLVQIPLQLGPVLTTWGSFTFPLIFLATDLTVRVLGRDTARRVVLWAMGPALLASYVVSVLFAEGRFAGWASLAEFNLFVFRIACASFAAYVVGQITDIQVPVRAAYECVAAKDLGHAITTTTAAAVVDRKYQTAFVLRQGDSNNDDVVDIYDFSLFAADRGLASGASARSNFNADVAINNADA